MGGRTVQEFFPSTSDQMNEQGFEEFQAIVQMQEISWIRQRLCKYVSGTYNFFFLVNLAVLKSLSYIGIEKY